MLILNIEDENVKIFMNKLMKENVFDSFEVRGVELSVFTKFEISGILDKKFINNEDGEEDESSNYCTWEQLKPYVFNIIKGTKKPTYIKIIFSYPQKLINNIHDNAQSLFLNFTFENNTVTCITGISQKNFSIEKDLDNTWEEYIIAFINNAEILFTVD